MVFFDIYRVFVIFKYFRLEDYFDYDNEGFICFSDVVYYGLNFSRFF